MPVFRKKAHGEHRTHSVEFKRQVVQEYLGGETLHGLSNRHDLSRTLIRIWVDKFQAGALDEEIVAVDLLETCEARIAALERLVGKQALALEFLEGGSASITPAEKRAHIHHGRPRGLSAAEGCRLMGIARSTLYDEPPATTDDTALVEAMSRICEEFERYGWRRVRAALRQRGMVVNHEKARRLMREHDLQPRMRRR